MLLLMAVAASMCRPQAALGQLDKEAWKKEHGETLLAHRERPPLILRNGGPDAYGYYFIDSHDLAHNAPQFQWIDIAGIGTRIPLQQDDQTLGPFNLGFEFSYYGQIFTGLRICSNGWISFTSSSPEPLNRSIPTGDEPNNILAVFWDDLLPDTASRAYLYRNNRDTCIVAWQAFRRYSGQGGYTFEAILSADGAILYQYLDVEGVLDSHTIGIENASGSTGLEYVFDSQHDESGMAIYFGLHPPSFAAHDVLPTSFRAPQPLGAIGDSVFPAVNFFNNGLYPESFDVRLTIDRGIPFYDHTMGISDLPPELWTHVIFPLFVPGDEGLYQFTATSRLANDQIPINDTLRLNYFVYSAIYRDGFEGPESDFHGDNDWQRGTPTSGPGRAHSGFNAWATNLDGDYSIGPLLSSLMSPAIVVDSGAVLTFWQWYSIEALFDGGNVKISADDGGSWEMITPVGGYDGVVSDLFQNPLGGQQAFYGASGDWTLETFNLAPYADSIVMIRFDFGSDVSTVAPGWYIDDFIIYGARAAQPGWLTGIVTDLATSDPISGAAIMAGARNDSTDADGRYFLELNPGLYSLTASARYYNTIMINDVVVTSGDTATQDLQLPSPAILIDTTTIDTSVVQGRMISISRQLANTGTGTLEFQIDVDQRARPMLGRHGGEITSRKTLAKPGPWPEPLDFGDEVFVFDPQAPTGDNSCVGVEFDGANFWVTGRHPADDVHKLYRFDLQGNLIDSYNQNTVSTWGWRDLAWDGEYLYASDENELAQIDPQSGRKVDTLPMPSSIPPPIRALAYDPQTDHFWGANFSSDIIEFDRVGQTLRSFPSDRHIFGLAWDDVSSDGPWLWVFSQDGDPLTQVSQFDPANGFFTDVQFHATDHNGGLSDLAGGACFSNRWDPTKGILFCLVMGRTNLFDSFDLVQGYEITTIPQWLSVEPASGAVAPGGSLELLINLDFSDSTMAPDSLYLGRITVSNNGRETPQVEVSAGLRSGVDSDDWSLPFGFQLQQNYPNPFNASTRFSFSLPARSHVALEIFDILGERIAVLIDKDLPAGNHGLTWRADKLASGLYIYRLSAGKTTKSGKMILLK